MGFLASPVKISLFGSLSQPLPLASLWKLLAERERERFFFESVRPSVQNRQVIEVLQITLF
jgi:hypothetical protein